jgi:ATP-dependent DNA helicase RecQ
MADFKQILLKYWGYSNFRPLQEDIIRSVFEGKDSLGLMPTGGGKSITFQVPAMAMEGICIVVTPLIALMKDQVENLKKKEIRAVAIHSGLSKDEIDIALDNCIFGNIKFLYLSPERLRTEIFRVRVQEMNVCLIAIDESHCISQWGYDFRPSYLQIAEIRELLPDVPLLALTATATERVVDDIMERLNFREKLVFRKSFLRSNLVYRVDKVEDKRRRLLAIVKENKGSGVVYVRNRKNTREIALFLKDNGISADYYHAGLSYELRSARQEDWQRGKTRVIVSTNAFGMGIDKADVRFVVHIDMPDAPEAYFQEAGRAGRDEKPAIAVLLYNESDKRVADKRVITNFPDLSLVKDIYHALGNFLQIPFGAGKGQTYDFVFSEFLSGYKFNALVAHNALLILQKEGYIELSDELHNPSKIHFSIQRDDLYKFQISNARFDGFIKLLLRSYSGLFSDYVSIDENVLSKRSSLKLDDVQAYISKLQNLGVIKYIPRRKNPVITFTEERLDKKDVSFSVEAYHFLKERFIEKIQAMLQYASGDTKCRSQVLLAYFGEKDSARCGKCDVCQQRNELDLSKYEFDLILKDVKILLKKAALSMNAVVDQLSYPDEKVIKVFQWLVEHKKIIQDEKMLFRWNED